MIEKLLRYFKSTWSTTQYVSADLTAFAVTKMVRETRKGLEMMSLMTIIILVVEVFLQLKFEPEQLYLYTSGILIVLSINIFFAARTVTDLNALHMLGITLLVVSSTAFVLLAHYYQAFTPMLFASIAMLFVIIPMVPWGLREALAVTLLIYSVFTLSTSGAHFNFADQSLWTLQFTMLGTGMVSLSLVVRNVRVRKHDLETQHNLIVANGEIAKLSNRDPLTGAWNRRYFDNEFEGHLERWRAQGFYTHFMLIDIDDFKDINDSHGHEWGDRVLEFIREAFNGLVLGKGHFIRMGGDEFVVVFADLDPVLVATEGVTRLTELTRGSEFTKTAAIGLSMGVASVPPDIKISYRQFYKQADLALYMAKNNKGDGVPIPNIVISSLTDPEDLECSTIRLWNSATAH